MSYNFFAPLSLELFLDGTAITLQCSIFLFVLCVLAIVICIFVLRYFFKEADISPYRL